MNTSIKEDARPNESHSTSQVAGSEEEVAYYTVSDDGFFLGTVMLLNSLRLTGNVGELVVLDVGLTPGERELLASHARVIDSEHLSRRPPPMLKAYPYLLDPAGPVVVIDSDIIVTGSLDPAIELARAGKICACPAWAPEARARWFAEWEETLGLRAPLRHEDWFHTGFMVFATEHWPNLLERWWDLCGLVPLEKAFARGSAFSAPDADVLNALLMSELPRESLTLLADGEEAFGGDVEVKDIETLACTLNGRPTRMLHYPDSPKPWQQKGWLRVATPHARIMRRLLLAQDLTLRLEPNRVPLWLRPDFGGRFMLVTLGAVNHAIVSSAHIVPEPVSERMRRIRRRIA